MLEGMVDKLRAIVMDNALWYSKAIYDVVFNELYHVGCLDFF